MALARFAPAALENLSAEQRAAEKLEAFTQQYRIEDARGYEVAQTTLLQVSERLKSLAAFKKEADAAVKVLLAPYKAPIDLFQKCKDYLKSEILRFEREEADRQAAALAEAQAAAALLQAAGENGNEAAAEQVHQLVLASAQGTQRISGIARITTYKARVIDPKLVPDKYWVIDEAALNREARESKGTCAIPGVAIEVIEGVRA